MPTIYKIGYPNADKPIAQEVEKTGFPNLDADGEKQYVNTHFTDEGDAWIALERGLTAHLSSCTRAVVVTEKELQKAKDELAKVAILLENCKTGMCNFLKI